ncbi:TPA: hypothetical protein ACH3X3_002712 [Trebouxia sp. C0006]
MRDSSRLRFAFNPAGSTLAVVSDEGTFRLFDTGSGRLQVQFAARPQGAETSQPCTSFAWASIAQQKAKRSSGSARQLIVVGNGAGEVAAFDTALGEEIWRVSDCHQGSVTGVAGAGAGSHHIYSVGTDAMACTIDALTGKVQQQFEAGKHALTCVKAASDGQSLLLGSSGLAVWDAVTQQRLYKYPGHVTPADALAYSPDGQYALSSSLGERHVAVWKATGKASKKTKPAAALLSMEQPPVQLDVAAASNTTAKISCFNVLAVSTAGRVCVWQCEVSDSVKSTLRATIQIEQDTTSPSRQQESILAACFDSSAAEEAVLVASGLSAKPTIQRIILPPLSAAPSSIDIKSQTAEGVLLPSKHKSRSAQANPVKDAPMAVVGADNSGHVVMLKPHSRKRQAEGGNGSDEAALDTQQGEGQQAVAEGREQQGQGQDAELTLEQRVNALQLHQTPGVQGAGDPAGPFDKAVSVTVLLTQALRADDRQLLEKCFAISNDKVVNSTVQQLAPQDVARLLQVAVQRLQSSPKRGKQIATWLRAMLLHHTAYLMSAPGVQASLTGLYQAIEARLALYKPLVSLQGRLDLVLAQAAPADPLSAHLAQGPLMYHDEDESLQEVEVEDVLALQGKPDAESESEESAESDQLSTSSSDDESEGD